MGMVIGFQKKLSASLSWASACRLRVNPVVGHGSPVRALKAAGGNFPWKIQKQSQEQ